MIDIPKTCPWCKKSGYDLMAERIGPDETHFTCWECGDEVCRIVGIPYKTVMESIGIDVTHPKKRKKS